MKIHPAQQGSLEWMMARAGIPTASEFDALLTPEFKLRTGEMPKTYLAKKVAESWIGGPLPQFNAWDMDQGKILEQEAIPFYELETGETVTRCGLITTDDGRVGCSPDGLVGDDFGIEVKCPEMHTHVRYLLSGELPKEYAAQVHGGMFVTGLKSWKFVSYRRGFPPLVLTVAWDEAIHKQIEIALATFLVQMDAALATIKQINGGPPKRQIRQETATQPTEPNDVPIP